MAIDKKQEIIAAIQKLARENDGKAPGTVIFERETGILRREWLGVYWSRWGDALKEAGLSPNELQGPIDKSVLFKHLIDAIRHFKKIPTNVELRYYKRNVNPSFPSHSVFGNRFHGKHDMITELAEYIIENEEYADIADLIGDVPSPNEVEPPTKIEGHVYLIKWGTHYKIGRTDNLERRFKQIQTALPEKGELVHSIRTDDPSGIEAYWHNRFSGKRAPNGEWFKLNVSDVRAFKRRKFQ